MTHEQRIVRVFVDSLGVTEEDVTPTARLIEDLRCDSLDVVEIAMALEDEFKIAITDDEALKIETVADAAALVDRLTAAAAVPAA